MAPFIDLIARVLALLSLAALAAALLRTSSASIRASIWTAALAAALGLPVVTAFTPDWRVPVWSGAESPAVGSPTSIVTVPPAVTMAAGSGVEPLPAVTFDTDVLPAASAQSSFAWSDIGILTFGLITLILSWRIAASYRRMARIANTSVDADPEWAQLVAEVGRELRIARNVPVRITDATSVPAVAGLMNPVLLLPIESGSWPAELRRAVILHELAHVARLDSFSQLLGQIACAVYWFVPLSWYGARRAAALRERASDDIVLQAGVRPSTYAQSLVALARATSGDPASAATLAMAERSRIPERVAAILTTTARRDRLSWTGAVMLFAFMCLCTVGIAAIEPVERVTVESGLAVAVPQQPAAIAESPASPVRARPAHDQTRPAAPAPPAPPPPPQAAVASGRFCSGRGLDHSSSSIQEDNNRRRWTVKLSGNGCSVDLRAEGDIQFNDDFTDVGRIGSGGYFRVDVTEGGVRRQLDIESKNGTLTRSWRIDGQERSYDADARAWFAAFLIELDRRTGVGADIRLPHLIRQGGVDAVLRETALITSDYARGIYYTKLPKAAKLSASDAARVLRQAAGLTSSDHYGSELVRAYSAWTQDSAARAAMFDLIERMKSDHYQAVSIEAIVGSGAPGQPDMDALVRLVPRMSSDHYKTQVLTKVLKADSVSASHRAAIARTVATIASDHYAAEVLKLLVQKGTHEDAVRRAFLDAAARIESDHYHAEVLLAVAAAPAVTERDLIDTVASAKGVGSDHYKAQVLERVARSRAATDRVRTAVLDAIVGLSSHYAQQVRRAAGR